MLHDPYSWLDLCLLQYGLDQGLLMYPRSRLLSGWSSSSFGFSSLSHTCLGSMPPLSPVSSNLMSPPCSTPRSQILVVDGLRFGYVFHVWNLGGGPSSSWILVMRSSSVVFSSTSYSLNNFLSTITMTRVGWCRSSLLFWSFSGSSSCCCSVCGQWASFMFLSMSSAVLCSSVPGLSCGAPRGYLPLSVCLSHSSSVLP
jgi:hypothetical protein